jgi:hypothetical protein
MTGKLRRSSPTLVVACIALFFALGGTAIAAAPTVKRALFANNAGKLQGKTAAQVAALPGPASRAAGLVSTKSAPFSLNPNEERYFTVPCAQGEKAISGGFTSPNVVLAGDTLPTTDGGGWQIYLVNLSASQAAAGTVQAVCIR